MQKQLPETAPIVIVGGGIVGSSVAYHLGKMGVRDVVLLERGRLTCGSTWHAAGLIMQTRLTHTATQLAKYNVELYSTLEAETGVSTGFKQNGTLGVARTEERLHETRRAASVAKSFGIEAHIISPAEASKLYPEMNHHLIAGAVFIPNDGQANPVDTTMSLIAGAKQGGALVFQETTVEDISRQTNGGFILTTSKGQLRCEQVVLACGLWTRDLAARLGINVPLYACEHMYVVTEALSFVKPTLPVLRDPDGHSYIKEDAGKLLVGAFEPQGKPLPMDRLPVFQEFIELPEDWEHFALPYGKAAEILPPLEDAGISTFLNGPESFTPDLMFVLGEPYGCPNCFVAAGFNSEGVEFGASAGKALAEWIVEGEPTMDLTGVDVNRFHPFQINRRYLHERAGESLGLHYKMHWPHKQREAGRPARRSAMHAYWENRNASFGEALGWERPLWFAPPGVDAIDQPSWFKPNWFPYTREECLAARQGVVVFDQSSFGKHRLQGPDACAFLQRICTGDLDVPNGKIVYTHMLNRRGGIETDITVNRRGANEYLIISSATTHARDKAWILRSMRADERVTLTDVTAVYAVLSVQGPGSRELLERLTDADLSNEAFPFATSQEIEIGFASVIANRLTFIGELGWELYIPVEFAYSICGMLLEAGEDVGLQPAGYHALEHLRSECGYREYQLDLTPEDTPLEAGLRFTVRLDKPGGFVGRDVLLQQSRQPLTRRMVLFRLRDPEPQLFHDELIRIGEEIVGYITSGAYGFTLGSSVGMGYVKHAAGVTPEFVGDTEFHIEIAGERFAADASLRSFYDPERRRVLG